MNSFRIVSAHVVVPARNLEESTLHFRLGPYRNRSLDHVNLSEFRLRTPFKCSPPEQNEVSQGLFTSIERRELSVLVEPSTFRSISAFASLQVKFSISRDLFTVFAKISMDLNKPSDKHPFR